MGEVNRAADPGYAWELLKRGNEVRVGRKVGRTVYVQVLNRPTDDDLLIGVFDSPEIAQTFVTAVRIARALGREQSK